MREAVAAVAQQCAAAESAGAVPLELAGAIQEALEVIEKECPSEECRYLVEFVRSSKRGIASSAHEQFQTLNAHYTKGKGALRRGGEGAAADDEDEVPADEIL